MATTQQPNAAKPKTIEMLPMETVWTYKPFLSQLPVTLSVSRILAHLVNPTRQGHKATNSDAIKFAMLCQARGLNPWEGDAYMVGYDTKYGPQFSLITAIQALYKRAEVHPDYDGLESGVIVKDGQGNVIDRLGDFTLDDDILLGAWSTVFFKNKAHPMKERVKLSAYKKEFGVWLNDPAGQCVKCAEASCLRRAFPSQLGGLYLQGEFRDMIDAVSTLAGQPKLISVSDKVADKLGAPPAGAATPTGQSGATAGEPGVSAGDEPPADDPPAGDLSAGHEDLLNQFSAQLDMLVEGGWTLKIEEAIQGAKKSAAEWPPAVIAKIEAMGQVALKQSADKKRGRKS